VAPLATLGIPETAPATPAPDSATATATPAQTPTSSVVIRPQIPPTQTSEQRWRDQQANRQPYEPPRQYVAQPGTTLFWFDPRTGQSLEIGTLLGEFTATAEFELRGSNQPALEVPYQINKDYGLTAISDALIRRMNDANYAERVEAYVVLSEAVKPK
jgi:hypothetical protein